MNRDVMVNEALLRCWGQTRCCAVMFVTLGQRRGDRRVEVGEDGVASTCGPLRLQRSSGSTPCSAQRLSLGSAAPPGGCLQTTFYKGIRLVHTTNATTYTTEINQMLPSVVVKCNLPRLCARSSFLPFSPITSMTWHNFSPSRGLSELMSYLSQFNHMVETHKCFSKHMLEQLQEVTYSNHRNLRRLEEQERNHKTFRHRSKCLTTRLEQDRERYVC